MSLISRLKAVVEGDDYLDDDFVDELDYVSEDDFNSQNLSKQNNKNLRAISSSNPFEFMNKSSKVVGMPGISSTSSEVNLIEPRSFDEMPQAIQALRERKTIILNLCLLYTSPSPRDLMRSRMPSSA